MNLWRSSKFINQEMHGSTSDQKQLQELLRSAIYPMQQMVLMVICCGMAVKGMGMLGVSARSMLALTAKM